MSYSSLGSVSGFGHYSGLGFEAGKFTGADLSKARGAPMVDVGVDASLIRALSAYLKALRASMGSDPAAPKVYLAAAYLDAMRLNSFSRFDPAAVVRALSAMPPALRDFVDGGIIRAKTPAAAALAGYTTSRLLSDIAAGRYAGKPAQSTMTFTAVKTFGPSASKALPGAVVVEKDAIKASYDSAAEAVRLAQQREEAQKRKSEEQAAQMEAERKAKEAATEIVKQAQPAEPSSKDLAPVVNQLPAEAFDTSAPPVPDSLVLEPGASEPVTPSTPATPKAEVFTKEGFLGVPWVYVAGIGLGVVAVGYGGWRMTRRGPTPNRRRKRARRASRRSSRRRSRK